jgi:hypothetical protein
MRSRIRLLAWAFDLSLWKKAKTSGPAQALANNANAANGKRRFHGLFMPSRRPVRQGRAHFSGFQASLL